MYISRTGALLAASYLVLSLACMLLLVFVTPPIQVPDEENHFLRADQISLGGLTGQLFGPTSAGGNVDSNAVAFARPFRELEFHPERHVAAEMMAAVLHLRWKGGTIQPVDLSNTVVYPPYMYLPGVIGVLLGKGLSMSVVGTFFLGRVCNGFAAVLVSAASIALAVRGQLILFVLLSLPMTLALFASYSPDAITISFAAFSVALITRLADPLRRRLALGRISPVLLI